MLTGQAKPDNKPFLIQGYTQPPRFCFLNGHPLDGHPLSNETNTYDNDEFCYDTDVNFTLLSTEKYKALNLIDIIGLNTDTTADRNEKMRNLSMYDITSCPTSKPTYNKSEIYKWLKLVNETLILDNKVKLIHIAEWLCLIRMRTGLITQEMISAPKLPEGWIVCCGLWCHTTIPFPKGEKSAGCTPVRLFPYMST